MVRKTRKWNVWQCFDWGPSWSWGPPEWWQRAGPAYSLILTSAPLIPRCSPVYETSFPSTQRRHLKVLGWLANIFTRVRVYFVVSGLKDYNIRIIYSPQAPETSYVTPSFAHTPLTLQILMLISHYQVSTTSHALLSLQHNYQIRESHHTNYQSYDHFLYEYQGARLWSILAWFRSNSGPCRRTDRNVSTAILTSLFSLEVFFLLSLSLAIAEETCCAVFKRLIAAVAIDNGSI